MIDPKFNELPADKNAAPNAGAGKGADAAETQRRASAGLSVRDTIAGDAMLSVGSRGVDVSGVGAGAGAGAGGTMLTPGSSSSPAPSIVPGARSTGTTLRGTTSTGTSPVTPAPEEVPGAGVSATSESHGTSGAADTYSTGSGSYSTESTAYGEHDYAFSEDELSCRAYECWCERGQPHGSPEVDWHRAVDDLRAKRREQSLTGKTSAASV